MFKSIDKTKKVCYNVKVENIGVSPSGKASDSDSDITGVRIPAPQPKTKDTNRYPLFFCVMFSSTTSQAKRTRWSAHISLEDQKARFSDAE